MNRKILTALAVVVVVVGLSMAGAAMAMESDAALSDNLPIAGNEGSAVTVDIPNTTTLNTTITISYPANSETGDGYKNIVRWYYKDGSNVYQPIDALISSATVADGTSTSTLNNLQVTTSDSYDFTIKASGGVTSGKTYNFAFQLLTVKASVEKATSELTDGDVLFNQCLYYKLKVANDVKATNMTYQTDSNNFTYSNHTLKLNQFDTVEFNMAEHVGNVTNGIWFAQGLPDGLSITPAGMITGKLAAASCPDPVVLTAFVPKAEDHAATSYVGALVITITTNNTVTITPAVGEGMKSLGQVTVTTFGSVDRYATTLTAADNDAPINFTITASGTTLDGYVLYSVNKVTGERTVLDDALTGSPYTVNKTITGTGEFFIEISNGTTTKVLLSVVVIDAVDHVRAGIAFNIGTTP